MKTTINPELISEFREKVNGNSHFVYNQYSDISGINHWTLICSCMDWISVAVSHLVSAEEQNDDDINKRAMRFFTLISAIDMIYEASAQLSRVFLKSDKAPFRGEGNIFSSKAFCLDDNGYFKEIRACFGAHPVNLKGKDSGVRWFASWPSDPVTTSGSVLEVRLSSNKVGISDVHVGLNPEELLQFAASRYGYLQTLMEEIDRQYENFCSGRRTLEIPRSTDHLENLAILLNESKKRLDNDYYSSSISEIIRIFSAECSDERLYEEEKQYKNDLLRVAEEIRFNLQTMNIVDLETHEILSPPYPSGKLQYEISKLYGWIFGERSDPLLEFYLRQLNDFSSSKYNLITHDLQPASASGMAWVA